MEPEDSELAATVRALNAEARRGSQSHPDSDEILAYFERELSTGAAESLRDHLAVCPDCARRALDLAALSQPDLFLEQDPPARSGGPERSVVADFPRAKHNILGSVRFAYATAALFFLTSVALSVWLGMQLTRASAPRAGPRLTDFLPAEVVHRDGAIAPTRPIDAGADNVLILSVSSVDPAKLDLAADGLPASAGYRAEIVDRRHPERPVVWSRDDLELIDSDCTIWMPRRSLEPGAYGIRLYAPSGERLAEYELEVEER